MTYIQGSVDSVDTVAYCFRRGVAYMLAQKTVATTRRFLLGHSGDEQLRPYQSKVSTVDFPCMFRNLDDDRPVLAQSSISLNRSASAPMILSQAGELAVQQQHPRLQE